MIYCEWIEISQPIRRSNEIIKNRSLVNVTNLNIPTNFDFSTYKDFFSIIQPDIDFTKPIEPFNETMLDRFTIENKLMEKRFHIPNKHPANNVSNSKDSKMVVLNRSKSSIFSGISGIGGTREKFVINPLIVDPMLPSIELNDSNEKMKIKINEKKTIRNTDERVIFKHVNYQPFDFNGVLKFFTNIQQTFPMTAFTSIREKIAFLNSFKNDLIENIGLTNISTYYLCYLKLNVCLSVNK